MDVSVESLDRLLLSEEQCQLALFRAKWPNGFRCPKCAHSHCYTITTRRLPLYECKNCGRMISLISDTCFRGSRTPLTSWFKAIHLHSLPGGINALQLSRAIHVTYKTAWLMCHKLRHAMSQAEAEILLSGIVRVSDTLMYKVIGFPRNYMAIEQPVIVGTSENDKGEIMRVKFRVSPRTLRKDHFDSPDPTAFIRSVVDPESIPHVVIRERYCRTPNPNHELKMICRDAEGWLASTFRGVGTKHLQVYLDHYCYIATRADGPTALSIELLRDCVHRTGIDYPTLTGCKRRSNRPSRKNHALSSLAV